LAKLSKAKRKQKNKSPQEKKLDSKAAIKLFKSLPRKQISSRNIRPGTMILYKYNAKDKQKSYDNTPCTIILWRTKSHTLGINMHWMPIQLREKLIDVIYAYNKDNIKNNKPLEITYKQLKPHIIQLGALPIVRLYINSRMSNHGVIVPSDKMKIAARYSNENFKAPSAEKLFKKAHKDFRAKRSKRKRKWK